MEWRLLVQRVQCALCFELRVLPWVQVVTGGLQGDRAAEGEGFGAGGFALPHHAGIRSIAPEPLWMLDENPGSPFFLAKVFAAMMLAQNQGSTVNVTSVAEVERSGIMNGVVPPGVGLGE